MIRVAFVGLGYVGLTTAVCFAGRGFRVIGIELDADKLNALRHGESYIEEKNLAPRLRKAVVQGTLECTDEYLSLARADYIFLTVGTPGLNDGKVNLSQIQSASNSIGKVLPKMRGYPTIVVKSTVLPGTTRDIIGPILERTSRRACGVDFGLCSNPEFLREGYAVEDTLNPDKVVIGADDEKSLESLRTLYGRFYNERIPRIVETNLGTAELVKYANNAFLAMKVSYINMIARISERIAGADVEQVARAIGMDSRIGAKFLQAGPGFGGSCLSKDLKALVEYSKTLGIDPSLFQTILDVNRSQPDHILKMAKSAAHTLKGKRVTVLGLAFKAGTNDVRDSRSLDLIRRLLEEGSFVRAYDPMANESSRLITGGAVHYFDSAEESLRGSDLCIIMTAAEEFRILRTADFRKLMRQPIVLDARRVFRPSEFEDMSELLAVGLGNRQRDGGRSLH